MVSKCKDDLNKKRRLRVTEDVSAIEKTAQVCQYD